MLVWNALAKYDYKQPHLSSDSIILTIQIIYTTVDEDIYVAYNQCLQFQFDVVIMKRQATNESMNFQSFKICPNG